MATTEPKIRVFSMFPADSANPTGPNWIWVDSLSFPISILNQLQFTRNPYKWIRYATSVVIGAQGDLSVSQNLPHDDFFDYEQELPSTSVELYCHTSDAEKKRMYPIDPDDMSKDEDSVRTASLKPNFNMDVRARDMSCVLTGLGYERTKLADAAHLLAHGKGDSYINTYTRRRSRDPAGNDIVSDIDDVRNGVLLTHNAHSYFGEHIAFLMTPNFAMDTSDVDVDAPPTERRCTAHLFESDHPELLGDETLRSGCTVRMPAAAANEWPPDILFDAVYACAILEHFGAGGIKDRLRQWTLHFGRNPNAGQEVILDEQDKENQARGDRGHRLGQLNPPFSPVCFNVLPERNEKLF